MKLAIENNKFRLTMPYDEYDIIRIRMIPGSTWNKFQKAWYFPLSRVVYESLLETFGEDIRDDNYLSCHREFKDHQPKNKPYDHQLAAKEFVLDQFKYSFFSCGAALFMEMGTGKTFTTINIVETLHISGLVNKVLIIAPLSIVDTWRQEVEKHGTQSMSQAIPAIGSKKDKALALKYVEMCNKPLKFIIINPEGLGSIKTKGMKKIIQLKEGIDDIKPDMVVVDESTFMKKASTQRSKIIKSLYQHVPFKLILSGNPIPKGGEEIFSQYEFIEPGVYGTSFCKFRDKYFQIGYFKNIEGLYPPMEKEFNEKFHSIAFVARKEDCLDLPPKIYEVRQVEMTPYQAKLYKEMKKEAIVSYEDKTCSAPVVITKFLRLSQIAAGFIMWKDDEDEESVEIFDQNPKLNELISAIEEIPNGEQIVIWAHYNLEVEMISERLDKENITNVKFYGKTSIKERQGARDDFREKRTRVFIGNPAAGGKGLNDLIAAEYVIYYSNDYSAENRQQSEDRNHRNGTERVTYIDLIMKGTIDAQVLSVLRKNKNFSDAILERKLAI